MAQKSTLLPEWYPQEAIILAWPDSTTDWVPWLDQVQQVYIELIKAISTNQTGVILLTHSDQIQHCVALLPRDLSVLLVDAEYNDTWVRDYAFLTCKSGDNLIPVEFTFNGWGDKFVASKDNQVNQQVLGKLCQHKLCEWPQVLEGGAVEIDASGTVLSTQLCLTNPKRNGPMPLSDYSKLFEKSLGATRSVIFKHGHLEGDDTDGHIDTLVRFTDNQGLVVQSAFNRPNDSHFPELRGLVNECTTHFPEHSIYELPLPEIYNKDGTRLPASYANFLISNNTIFAPIYQQPEDKIALKVLSQGYGNYKIVPINCLPLVQQYGSLHCISMQVPKGTLKPNITAQFSKGVSQYGS